ncbi:Cytochrome p450 family protein [Thalictrum thalictroides]|uniref:Cytochrome p450 family protein n=1 Tax=Thalictrum thalictroides TaxID=46969 RepID=A0A7J6WT00_THATH|nr:Cytochrome p450 family protein [Thalictrum thalictroides]
MIIDYLELFNNNGYKLLESMLTIFQAMVCLTRLPTTLFISNSNQIKSPRCLSSSWKFQTKPLHHFHIKHQPILCTNLSLWEPSPSTYDDNHDKDGNFLRKGVSIFESISTDTTTEALDEDDTREDEGEDEVSVQSQQQPLKWPLWVLGPFIIVVTGMAPTLWLPLSSVFLGANVASLLSLIGLDCIFNIGATLFLLMADACARPKNGIQICNSEAPGSYRFWNMVASVVGFVVPLTMLFASHKGIFQAQLPFISFGVLLGPYLLLLAVQMLTEMLTWHWKSPVWLMTPVVYEAYRVLQLMRGLKLSAEIVAPMWTVETIRVLVSWWVLILGVQLMRVAWFAGFTARARQQS